MRKLRAVRNESLGVELTGVESAAFQFCPPKQQYVRLRIDHPGIPHRISVKHADRTLASFRGDWQRPSHVSFQTDTADCLDVLIQPFEAQEVPATFRITLQEIRDAKTTDAGCLRAQTAFQRGAELSSRWVASLLREAIPEVHLAALAWERCGERDLSAMAWNRLGYIRFLLSEYSRAQANYRKALALARAGSSASPQAEALIGLAHLTWRTAGVREGIELAESAASFARAHSLPAEELQALNIEAKLRYAQGELSRALAMVQDVELRARKEGYLVAEAQALSIMGYIHNSLADFRLALSSEERALSLWRTTGNIYEANFAVKFIGSIYTNLGEKQKSLDHAIQALEGFRKLGSLHGQMSAMIDLGYYYEAAGEFEAAQYFYESAARVASQLQMLRFVGELRGYIAQTRQYQGDFRGALAADSQTLQLVRTLRDQREEAWALIRIGWAHHELGNHVLAEMRLKAALELTQSTFDKRAESEAHLRLARLKFRTGKPLEARDFVEKSMASSRATLDPFRLLDGLLLKAQIELRARKPESAVITLQETMTLAEDLRNRLANPGQRASFHTTIHALYSAYVEALMSNPGQTRAERLAVAFEVSERGRARTLLELLAEARAGLHSGVPAELAERERAVRSSLDALAEKQITLLSGPHTPAQAEGLAKRIRELASEYDQIESQIRSANPRLASIANLQPLSAKEVQAQLLDSDTVLLEFALGEERSYLWALTPDTLDGFVLPSRAELEKSARRVHELLTARQPRASETPRRYEARVAAADISLRVEMVRLSAALLEPVAEKLRGRRLLIVPDGALHYVPFAALPSPVPSTLGRHEAALISRGRPIIARPLLADHEIVVLPSASALALLRQRPAQEASARAADPKAVAVFADPVFEMDDPRVVLAKQQAGEARVTTPRATATAAARAIPALRDTGWNAFGGRIPRLPATRQEAETILAFANPEATFKALDFDANRETALREDLRPHRVVHFATHGFVNTQHPELSGVLLSLVDRQGKPRNGFLRLQDVYDLRFHADLVVLSACNTALGKEMRGEGIVGLTRGFFYAGAARVLSTLWKVDDEGTAEFMRHFYRSMFVEGKSPAASLRAAQLELRKQRRWSAPYYWAAFVLQGEWR